MERINKENECQKQNINELELTNKILEERIYKKNIVQSNERNSRTRKEKGEKNDQNKGIKTSKKKMGNNSKN